MNKIIIAKPGYDATTETNPDHLVFSSDYNTLKYNTSGSETITIVNDGTVKESVVTVAHNLGYVPFFTAYVEYPWTYVSFPIGNVYHPAPMCPFYVARTATRFYEAEAYADTTNLYLRVRCQDLTNPTYAQTFYYKIFKNNLHL